MRCCSATSSKSATVNLAERKFSDQFHYRRFVLTTKQPQSREHHSRLDPAFHFILLPLLVILLVASIVRAVRHPHLPSLLLIFLIVAVFLLAFKARVYALRVQDRLIRLEERLRLATLLPADMQPGIAGLSIRQLIALRFASDAELPALAARAISEALTPQQIKAAILSWRADEFRV
ncbi:MAG: DUF6526 family protein [Acidobacteriaceae bacterium]